LNIKHLVAYAIIFIASALALAVAWRLRKPRRHRDTRINLMDGTDR
jgi:hypothetical protein